MSQPGSPQVAFEEFRRALNPEERLALIESQVGALLAQRASDHEFLLEMRQATSPEALHALVQKGFKKRKLDDEKVTNEAVRLIGVVVGATEQLEALCKELGIPLSIQLQDRLNREVAS